MNLETARSVDGSMDNVTARASLQFAPVSLLDARTQGVRMAQWTRAA